MAGGKVAALQGLEILNDAVVDDNDAPGLVKMRMRILV